MDWPFWAWRSEGAISRSPDHREASDDEIARQPPAGSGQTLQPTAVDMWLVQLTYQIVAAESCCQVCSAPLGRRVRVLPLSAGDPPSWRLSVVTKCKGWKRHGHIATVTEKSSDIVLGPFSVT
jgi:hypothetical protein